MNKKILLSLLGMAALALTACGGSEATKPGVEDKSVGAESSGVGAGTGVDGKTLDGKGKADLLAKRRVYFAFDSSAVDNENRAIVEAHAAYLAANKNIKVVLEGNTDERGTREYNLALGERRAEAVARMVKLLGIAPDRIKTVSYGEEKPIAMGHTEADWALNRRVEIIY
jgi:peptidoglycan-associated lipoprotein